MSQAAERLAPLRAPAPAPGHADAFGLDAQVSSLVAASPDPPALILRPRRAAAWLGALGDPLQRCRRLFARAGFPSFHCHALEPGADDPASLRPVRIDEARRLPAVLVAAGRDPAGSGLPLVDALFAAVAASDGDGQPRLVRVLLSDKHKSLVFFERQGRTWVARLPHSAAAARAEDNAHRLVGLLHRQVTLAPLLPAPQRVLPLAGGPAYVEPCVPGRPLGERVTPASRAQWAAAVRPVLAALNERADGAPVPLHEGFAQGLLDELAPHLPPGIDAQELQAAVAAAVDGANCRVGPMHGDFSAGNLFVDGERVSGLIDWEDALERAPCPLDTCNYLDSVHRRCTGVTLAETLPLLAGPRWPVAAEEALLAEAMQRGGLLPGHRRGLAILYWLYHVVPQLRFATPGDAAHRRLLPVLHWILGR